MKQPNEPDYPVIVYLTEPEAHFVSLVKRGANRTPFHIAKQETEPMKIIHRIIAKKGTDADAIKAAVGEEASQLLKLDAPTESGAFTVYEQHKVAAFKADSLEVVSLADDNSIICLCGELAKKSEGFISKLLDRKESLTGIEIPHGTQAIKSDVLKSVFSCQLFDELYAMESAISGILQQKSSGETDKAAVIKTICDNFLKSLDTAMQVIKSDVFLQPMKEEAVTKEKDMNLNLEDTQKAEARATPPREEPKPEPKKNDKAEETQKGEASPKDKTSEALSAMKASFEEMGKQIESLKSELEALKKTPATPVQSHSDNPQTQKSEKSVFAGVFGNFSRM